MYACLIVCTELGRLVYLKNEKLQREKLQMDTLLILTELRKI